MDRDTFDQMVRVFKNRKPFHPFTIAMQNGDRIEIDHPDALAVRDGVALFAGPGGVPSLFDHESVNRITGELLSQSTGDAPAA